MHPWGENTEQAFLVHENGVTSHQTSWLVKAGTAEVEVGDRGASGREEGSEK